ncbi:MAG: hypothetical protein GY851_29410 [bacterium]|nr:hypothetical protein [bacterium]
MKAIQQILFKVLCLGVLLGGVLLLIYRLTGCTDLAIQYLPQNLIARWTLKILIVAVAALGLVPASLFAKRRRRISFPSAHGTNDCYLDSLESSLNKALAKLPQVRKTALELLPAANGRMIRISGEVWLAKTQDGGFRETSAFISEKIAVQAKRMLGVDEVDTVHLSFHYPKLDLDLSDTNIDLEEEVRTDGPGREATESEVIVGPDAHFAEDAESSYEDEAGGEEEDLPGSPLDAEPDDDVADEEPLAEDAPAESADRDEWSSLSDASDDDADDEERPSSQD